MQISTRAQGTTASHEWGRDAGLTSDLDAVREKAMAAVMSPPIFRRLAWPRRPIWNRRQISSN